MPGRLLKALQAPASLGAENALLSGVHGIPRTSLAPQHLLESPAPCSPGHILAARGTLTASTRPASPQAVLSNKPAWMG